MEDKNDVTSFKTQPGFCPDCGSILPWLGEIGRVTCYDCQRQWGPEAFGNMAVSYVIHFNDEDVYTSTSTKADTSKEPDGPVVDRRCLQCGNNKMSYATLQLRSADEGQTVFYTCTKCKFKETENS